MNSSAAVNLTITVLTIMAIAFGAMGYSLAMHGKEYVGFLTAATGSAGAVAALLASTNTKPKEADSEATVLRKDGATGG